MTNEEKYRQILEATKALFLEELRKKSAGIVKHVGEWREGLLPDHELIDRLYRATHTLKGVALTVGFEDVHDVAEQVSELKYRSEEAALSIPELNQLADIALTLRKYQANE